MRAGPPAADPRPGVVGEAFGKGHLGIVHLGVLAEMNVVEARRVLHHHGHGDRMRAFPAVGEGDFGGQVADRGVEIEATAFHRVKHRQGREALRDGPDPEQVVFRHVDAGGHVGLADAARPDRPVPVNQRDRGAGNPVLVEDLLDLGPQSFDVDGYQLGIPIGSIRFLGRDCQRQRGRQRQRASQRQRHATRSPHEAHS